MTRSYFAVQCNKTNFYEISSSNWSNSLCIYLCLKECERPFMSNFRFSKEGVLLLNLEIQYTPVKWDSEGTEKFSPT